MQRSSSRKQETSESMKAGGLHHMIQLLVVIKRLLYFSSMPRKRTQSVKESITYCYCRFCKANRNKCRFDKHQIACKFIWKQAQQLQLSAEPINQQTEREKVNNSLIKVNFRFPT